MIVIFHIFQLLTLLNNAFRERLLSPVWRLDSLQVMFLKSQKIYKYYNQVFSHRYQDFIIEYMEKF
jgi:hypothetical protein